MPEIFRFFSIFSANFSNGGLFSTFSTCHRPSLRRNSSKQYLNAICQKISQFSKNLISTILQQKSIIDTYRIIVQSKEQ